ncbi:Pre-mRNA splicing factor-domain-containing protein, partial [Limtongia smithiae]|uniref:Pre-mRNA splicing factor-domain-containing protein n=1 Tax=Limtongia smithiae TaxID=1125753 RepID=UPI0034CD6B0B
MGGDLNLKKSWHPGLMRNQEAVWKREQEALEERKKIAERQREIQEERELAELQGLQEAAGGKRRVDRVEWMYAAPQGGNLGVSEEVEAFLLGKNVVEQLLQESEGMGAALKEDAQIAFVRNGSATASGDKDASSKEREDPLFTIKKEQQAVVNAIRNNPRRLAELRAARRIPEARSSTSRRHDDRDRERHRSHYDDRKLPSGRDERDRNVRERKDYRDYKDYKERSERRDHSERSEHSERRDHSERSEHSKRSEQRDWSERSDRRERSYRED